MLQVPVPSLMIAPPPYCRQTEELVQELEILGQFIASLRDSSPVEMTRE
jgi:hypothetical protein